MIINAGINLSKIDKGAIKKSKTGESWINVTIKLHNPDKFDNVLSIQQYVSKENKPYIGNGKLVKFEKRTEAGIPQKVVEQSEVNHGVMQGDKDQDDLPF